MGKGSKTQQLPFEKNNEYKFYTPPDTEDTKAFRSWNPEADPSRPYQFARQRRDILNLYNNPLGAYTTPELREQMTKSALEENAQQEGQSALEENAQLNNAKGQKLGSLAALTAPQLQQSKQSGFESQQKQGSGLLNSLVGGGLSVVAAF